MKLPPEFQDQNVCVIGLGYVGMTLAVAMADVGFRVCGVEISEAVLGALREGRAHFSETGLDAKLREKLELGRFSYSSALEETAERCSVYLVTVGTPVGSDKRTKFRGIETVIRNIATVLRDGDLVVLRSTVRVGTTREVVKPMLDEAGVRYHLAYCPERTLEGRAMTELRSLPQVVGGIDDASTLRAAILFSFMTPSIVRVHDAETAEMVKLINNTQRDYTFAFSNEVAAMCDAIGISAAEVIASGNLGYARANLPMPGPVGGPCLEKDPYILAEGLERYGFTPSLALAGRRWNEQLPAWTVGAIARHFRSLQAEPPKQVAILGVAFKGRPETDDLRGTLASAIVEMLRSEFSGSRILGWDPIVNAEGIRSIGAEPVESLRAAFDGSSIVVIQNNHECFAKMSLRDLSSHMRQPGLVYDYWNQHDARSTNLTANVAYRGLGSGGL